MPDWVFIRGCREVSTQSHVSGTLPIFSGETLQFDLGPPAYRPPRIGKDTSEQVIFRPLVDGILCLSCLHVQGKASTTSDSHDYAITNPTVDGARARYQRDEHPAGPEPRRRRIPTRHRLEARQGWRERARVAVEQVADDKHPHRNRLLGPHAARPGQARRLELGHPLQGRPAHRRPPHGRRRLHCARQRLRYRADLDGGARPVRLRIRAARRGAQPRGRGPFEQTVQCGGTRPEARKDRRPQLRDDPALPAELRPGRPRHPPCRLPARRERPPQGRVGVQGPGRGDPYGDEQGPRQGGRGAEHQGDVERAWLECCCGRQGRGSGPYTGQHVDNARAFRPRGRSRKSKTRCPDAPGTDSQATRI